VKVLADYHHHDLWESHELTMTDRFGWSLYRPIGMDWFDAGYWNFERQWHGDKVARQYLEPWGSDVDMGDHFLRYDSSHLRQLKMLTLQQARDAGLDIVIASVEHNHEGLARFASETGAHFGVHLGNVRFGNEADRWDLAEFGILTTKMTPPWRPHVTIHQEFSLVDFHYEPPPNSCGCVNRVLNVSSFVNCFAENGPAYAEFRDTAKSMPDMHWRVYGSYGSAPPDEYAAGNLDRCSSVATAMRASDVAWHTKQWSDGFGHVIHDWFAVGRPVFGSYGYYRNQLAGPLWVEGETSFDLDTKSRDEVAAILRHLHDDPDWHRTLCENAARRFREVVSFDDDAAALRSLLENVASDRLVAA